MKTDMCGLLLIFRAYPLFMVHFYNCTGSCIYLCQTTFVATNPVLQIVQTHAQTLGL